MDFDLSESQLDIRSAVADLCKRFPLEYWRDLEPDRYPERFVEALTEAGWLSVLIPEQYGGGGLGVMDASLILEEINASGGNAAACHAQMYTMGAILRHGTEAQKRRYLPAVASGSLRLQAFGITEPDAGSDTLNIKTFARRDGDDYIVSGQKVFVSRALYSDMMLLLRAHDAEVRGPEKNGWPFSVSHRSEECRRYRHQAPHYDDQSLNNRGVLRRPPRSRRGIDRR